MLLTEEEAKTKWCPFIRITARGTLHSVSSVNNRGDSDYSDSSGINYNCIASDCMAWRWHNDIGPAENQPEGLRTIAMQEYQTNKGYCGKAGKPE